MTLSNVLQAGNFSFSQEFFGFFRSGFINTLLIFFTVIIIFVFCMIIIVSLFVDPFVRNINDPKHLKVILPFSIILFCIVQFFIIQNIGKKPGMFPYDQWVNQYVAPYIQSLPTQKVNIQAVRILIINKDDDNSIKIAKFLEKTNSAPLIPVSILYKEKNKNGVVFDSYAIEKFDLKKGQTPYMTYKNIPSDLGHGINAGMIDPILHLPTGYYFNQ